MEVCHPSLQSSPELKRMANIVVDLGVSLWEGTDTIEELGEEHRLSTLHRIEVHLMM